MFNLKLPNSPPNGLDTLASIWAQYSEDDSSGLTFLQHDGRTALERYFSEKTAENLRLKSSVSELKRELAQTRVLLSDAREWLGENPACGRDVHFFEGRWQSGYRRDERDDIYADALARIEDLVKENSTLKNENSMLIERVRDLEAKVGAPLLDSTTSSKPPSTDIGKKHKSDKDSDANTPDGNNRNKPGGQKGHVPHFRLPFKDDEAETRIISHEDADMPLCGGCGKTLVRCPEKDLRGDFYELPSVPVTKVIEKAYAYVCPTCGKIHYKRKPGGWQGNLANMELVAEILTLKSIFHASMRDIQYFLEVKGVKLSTGKINDLLKESAAVMRPAYLELADHVKDSIRLNIDETSLSVHGKMAYVWAFKGADFVVFKVGTREASNLNDMIGDNYKGGFTSDFYAAYTSYLKRHPDVLVQFCLAHLIRDFKFCHKFDSKEISIFGNKGVTLVQSLIHKFNEYLTLNDKTCDQAVVLMAEMHSLKKDIISLALTAPSGCKKAKGINKRFLEFAENYFTFLDHPGFEPTNNAAERAIRTLVLDRRISQGTKSIEGNHACETMWTIKATLRLREVDLTSFIKTSLASVVMGEAPPSAYNYGQPVDPKYVQAAIEEQETCRKIKKDLKIRGGLKAIFDRMKPSHGKPDPKPSEPAASAKKGGNDGAEPDTPPPGKRPEQPEPTASAKKGGRDGAEPDTPPPGKRPEQPEPATSAKKGGKDGVEPDAPPPGKRPEQPEPAASAKKGGKDGAEPDTPPPGKRPEQPEPATSAKKGGKDGAEPDAPPPGKRPEQPEPASTAHNVTLEPDESGSPPSESTPDQDQPLPEEAGVERESPVNYSILSKRASPRAKASGARLKASRPPSDAYAALPLAPGGRRRKAPDSLVLEPARKGPIASAEALNLNPKGQALPRKLTRRPGDIDLKAMPRALA